MFRVLLFNSAAIIRSLYFTRLPSPLDCGGFFSSHDSIVCSLTPYHSDSLVACVGEHRSPTSSSESGHWQSSRHSGEPSGVAITRWYCKLSCATTYISSTHLGRSSTNWHNNAVGRRLVVGFCGQPASTLCLKKNRTPVTFSNNYNNPSSISTDFGIKNRQLIGT